MTIDPERHSKIPEVTPAKPDIQIELNELEERGIIGRGGTADVMKMYVEEWDQTIAVKQPQLEGTLSTEVAEKFVSEAKTWEKLDDHDGIVGVVDWGKKPVPWIALEYMNEGSLTSRLGEISTEEGLWIGIQVSDAVWGAHRRGVAHLDLKPDNILFRATDADLWNVPKVSDWGLAKMLLYHSQSVDGLSPHYSAPEQFDSATYGSPSEISDIYQLGSILYEVLTGEKLFTGQSVTVMNSHITETPVPPTELDGTLPSGVNDVLGTALEKEKEDRYESMLDFRRDLSALFRQVAFEEDVSLICDRQNNGGYNPNWNEQSPQKNSDSRGLKSGSTLNSGDEPGILDNIRENSKERGKKNHSQQRREDAASLDRNAEGTRDIDYGTGLSDTPQKNAEDVSQPDYTTGSSGEGITEILRRKLREIFS